MADEDAVIWLNDVHSGSGRAAVVEDDGVSCWLYLLDKPDGAIVRSVLVYSAVPPITAAEFRARGQSSGAPPLVVDYASASAVVSERVADDFSFRWRADGSAVAVLHRGKILAVAAKDERYESSRALSQSGPFGDPLDLDRYPWLR